MIRIIFIIASVFFVQTTCLAQTQTSSPKVTSPKVTFIYTNGSNSNSEKDKVWFNKGVAKFHPMLKQKIEKNQDTVETEFNKYKYAINPQPKLFYWGDESKKDLEFMRSQLSITKSFSPTLAFFARKMISAYLHDAIWVQKDYHMFPILDSLNKSVKEEYQKGNKVVLFGYSAGTFIAYEYMFNKYRYMGMKELFDSAGVDDEIKKFIAENPRKNTCLSAIETGKLGVFNQEGKLILDNVDERLKEHYLKIDETTEAVCAPEDTVLGAINFASPIALFYSDLTDPKFEFFRFNKYLLKYIMENDLIFVTINFREDPLGFPSSKNLTVKEMEAKTGIEIVSPKGIFFDNSDVKSWRSFLFAHTSYYNARRIFSNAIVKTMVDGYRFQYDTAFQAQMIKKRDKVLGKNP